MKLPVPLPRSGKAKLFGALLVATVVVGVGPTTAASATPGRILTNRIAWRHTMARLAVPTNGCFTGSYPSIGWQRVPCHVAPRMPFAPLGVPRVVNRAGSSVVPEFLSEPARGPAQQTVGNGYDYSAEVSSLITSATGSFPYISPGTTEAGQQYGTGPQVANTFSLQLNTQFFTGSPACSGATVPANCLAWQQFVYSATSGGVFMQYWLIDYNAACPGGWYKYGNDCYTNSNFSSLTAAAPTMATLGTVTLTGTARSGGSDSVVMEYGANNVSAVGADSVVDLGADWNTAEFAIVGDGDGTEANFSSGAKLDVETKVNDGSTAAPGCDLEGFTGETNNLSFASAPSLSKGSSPAIETQQTSAGGTAGCATAGESAPPAAPTKVKATSGATVTATGTLRVSFTLGANNGSTITRQTATCASSNGGATRIGSHIGATAAPITVSGVTTGKKYRCKVEATNAAGGTSSTASLAVIVGSPAAPTGVTAAVVSGHIKVSFTLGANNGSSITSQTATCTSSDGGVTKTGTHVGATAAPITVAGVTTDKHYTCTVEATNARGPGLASNLSGIVTTVPRDAVGCPLTECAKSPDINGDGVVSQTDYNTVVQHFGQNFPPAEIDGAEPYVESHDLSIVASYLGCSDADPCLNN